MKIGYKLATEQFGPKEIVRQAQRAEEVGFDFVEMSDHYHPWLDNQGHSALHLVDARHDGGEDRADRPGHRGHLPELPVPPGDRRPGRGDGRDPLRRPVHARRGLRGAAERAHRRQGVPRASTSGRSVLREALEIIKLLWQGGYQSYEGKHLQLEDARVFDLPDELPLMPVAAGGPAPARIAAELGDGLFATEPKSRSGRGVPRGRRDGPRYAEVPLAWAPDEEQPPSQAALETFRWALHRLEGDERAAEPGQLRGRDATVARRGHAAPVRLRPGPRGARRRRQQYVDAGFDHIVLQNAGPDPDGFLDFFASELGDRVRGLTPSS